MSFFSLMRFLSSLREIVAWTYGSRFSSVGHRLDLRKGGMRMLLQLNSHIRCLTDPIGISLILAQVNLDLKVEKGDCSWIHHLSVDRYLPWEWVWDLGLRCKVQLKAAAGMQMFNWCGHILCRFITSPYFVGISQGCRRQELWLCKFSGKEH